tara:strand:+ start:1245 stop:2603 length:1359 start_codon:yes stop_codon:yes gene_type:complete
MNFRQLFLDQLVNGDTMKDYKHAARLYLDEAFRLSPKNRFLYHVVFNINPLAAGNMLNRAKGEQIELGMLTKSVDLPAYQFNVEMKNQYNYKNYVQTGITYEPVTVTLHDDMGDVATAFFKSYYQHYMTDTLHQQGEYNAIKFDNKNTPEPAAGRWGMDNGEDERFLNSISIFQLHRQRFTEFRLMNPIINDYRNGSMDQADGGGISEQSFSVSYSGVLIEAGAIKRDKPQGFAVLHYDNTKSPISPLGGGTDSIFGSGGVLAGISTAFGLAKSGNFLGALLSGVTTYKTIKRGKATRGIKEEIFGLAGTFLSGARNNLGATSRPGVNFPKDVRRRRRTAQSIDSQLNNVINEQTKTTTDKEIFLAGNQVSDYLTLDTNAKLRFAKFETFRRDENIDPNNVETEWAKLSTEQQNTYINQAPADAKILVKNGKINYKVSKQKYNAVVAQQGNT